MTKLTKALCIRITDDLYQKLLDIAGDKRDITPLIREILEDRVSPTTEVKPRRLNLDPEEEVDFKFTFGDE